ncbi:MAG: hypothetical protein AAF799_29740 [Myxococcota bacterium]
MKIVSTLDSCPTCDGFMPAATARCPHCGAAAGWSRRAKNLARLAGGSAIAVTMMACYGAPPPGPMPTDPPQDPGADGADPAGAAEAGDAKAEAGESKAEAGAAEAGESKAEAGGEAPAPEDQGEAKAAADPSAP